MNEVNEEFAMNEDSGEVCDAKEEMSKGKPIEMMRRGSAAKSEVRTSWEPGESGAATFVEVRSDVNVEAKVEVFGMKEVKTSGGAIEKALMIVMFLMKERFVNRFRPDC